MQIAMPLLKHCFYSQLLGHLVQAQWGFYLLKKEGNEKERGANMIFMLLLQAELEHNNHMSGWGKRRGGRGGVTWLCMCLGKELETVWKILPFVFSTKPTMME